MPASKPRPASPRRSAASSPARRSSGSSRASRTLDMTAPQGKAVRSRSSASAARKRVPRQPGIVNPDDPGVVRRARKKAEAKRKAWIALAVVAFVSVPIMGATMGVWQRYQETRTTKMAPRETLLHDLQVRLEDRQRQLQALASPTGKQRALVENGYLREGERLLLFPRKPDTQTGSGVN